MVGYEYNGVKLQECLTLSFDMEMERDPTGSDALWNKYTIRVRGFLTLDAASIPLDTSTLLLQIKNRLEAPRRGLIYKTGPIQQVVVGDGNVTNVPVMDARYGPDPLPAVVRQVTAGTYAIECGVVCRVVSCDPNCQPPSDPVVSLRWSQTESFDENWYSHITTTGKLIVRSDMLTTADTYRPLCVPAILDDYIRTVSKYTLAPTGTELDFTFEDREVDRLPPTPATKAEGNMTIQVMAGTKRSGTVTIMLEGPKGTDRRLLLIRALQMAYAKLGPETRSQNPGGQHQTMIINGSVSEDLFVPKVRVTMTSLLSSILYGNNGTDLISSDYDLLDGVGKPTGKKFPIKSPLIFPTVGSTIPAAGPGRPGLYPNTRNRLAGLLAAAFQDPCLGCAPSQSRTQMSTYGQEQSRTVSNDISDKKTNTQSQITQGPTSPPTAPTTVTKDSAPYTIWTAQTEYVYDTGLVQLPGTGVGSNADVSTLVRVSGAKAYLLTTWVAQRSGAPPVLPLAFPADTNLQFLDGRLVASDVVPTADGASLTYLFSGYYKHAIIDPKAFEMVAIVAPEYSDAVLDGAKNGLKYWQDLYRMAGAAGTNPFVLGEFAANQVPQVLQAFQAIAQNFMGITPVTSETDLAQTNLMPNASGNPAGASSSSGSGPSPGVPPVNP